MRITLIISSLNSGGAEWVLSELANYWVSKGHCISLITLASVDVMNIVTLIATRGHKAPVIVSERTDPSFHIIPRLYSWLRLRVYPLCAKLIVQTESAARYFQKKFRKFLQVIPNPVIFLKNRKENFVEQVKNIITVGRLVSSKEHATLIYAFSNIITHYPDLTLTIYGEGEERINLENLIISLGFENKVFLPGTTKNVQEALMKADLFVFPSRYEGFPNALCEAMAIGLPVIASNCSGDVDIVRDGINGCLFPVGDVQALTHKMLELLEDFTQRVRLAKNAQDICVQLQPERIFELWDGVIQEVFRCGQAGPPSLGATADSFRSTNSSWRRGRDSNP